MSNNCPLGHPQEPKPILAVGLTDDALSCRTCGILYVSALPATQPELPAAAHAAEQPKLEVKK